MTEIERMYVFQPPVLATNEILNDAYAWIV